MKNLPDKIYLNFGDLTKEEYNELDFKDLSEVTWSEDDVQGMNVEYVRKDVFIEKACEWLEPVLKNYAGYYVGKDILGNFKNYINKISYDTFD